MSCGTAGILVVFICFCMNCYEILNFGVYLRLQHSTWVLSSCKLVLNSPIQSKLKVTSFERNAHYLLLSIQNLLWAGSIPSMFLGRLSVTTLLIFRQMSAELTELSSFLCLLQLSSCSGHLDSPVFIKWLFLRISFKFLQGSKRYFANRLKYIQTHTETRTLMLSPHFLRHKRQIKHCFINLSSLQQVQRYL